MARARFSHSFDALKAIASDALAHAGEKGASACEAEASDGYGQTVTVRKGEVETIEYNRDKSLSVTVYLGKRKGYASTADFAPRALPRPEAVGDDAGRRALARLASRKIQTVQAPVLFEAPAANGLLSSFVSAVSGGSLYRKASFLLDSLGKEVFSPIVTIVERPHLARGPASSWFDDEGVATRDRDVVKDGVLRGYFLGSYSARKLGMRTTGSAGG